MSDKDYSVANVMKLYRSLHGMTQEELGEKSGIEYSQVRRYEAGVRKPKLEQQQQSLNGIVLRHDFESRRARH